VNANGNGVITSTVLPPTTGTDTISTMYSKFTLASGVVSSTYYGNTNHLCGYTSPLRTGDYSGAAVDGNTAYVVSMTTSSDVCGSSIFFDTIATNWQSTITKVPL